MTPDTRTTENPEPRTEAGRRFVRDGETVNPLATVLAIEAEAAQGAAPRAEGPRYEQINGVTYERKADGHLVVAMPEAAPRAEGLDVLASILTKLIRQYHGVAHSGGSWTHCDDRWCTDMQEVLSLSPQERNDGP